MHQRHSFVLLASLLALAALSAPPVSAEPSRPRLAVIPFLNETGSASCDAACGAATDALVMTLHSLGAYEVSSLDASNDFMDDDSLSGWADSQGLDYAIYGAIQKGSGESIRCSLSVFDRSKGATTIRRETESAPAGLEATLSGIQAEVLEALTGTRLCFGKISLRRSGENGSYALYLDGASAGENVCSLPRVLTGKRNLRITQRRMLGEVELCRLAVDVTEGGETSVDFSVPYLLAEEEKRLSSAKAETEALLEGSAPDGAIAAAIASLESLLEDVSYSPRLALERGAALGYEARLAIRKERAALEARAWDPSPEILAPLLGLCAEVSKYPNPEALTSQVEAEARLLAALLELQAGERIAGGDYAAALTSYASIISIADCLPPERLPEYESAASILRSASPSRKADREAIAAFFGPRIEAGRRFYAMRPSVEKGEAIAIVPSNLCLGLKLGAGGYGPPPLALARAQLRDSAVLPLGFAPGRAWKLPGDYAGRILFVDDGLAGYGPSPAPEGSAGAGSEGEKKGELPQFMVSLEGSSAATKNEGNTLFISENMLLLSALFPVGGASWPYLGLRLGKGSLSTSLNGLQSTIYADYRISGGPWLRFEPLSNIIFDIAAMPIIELILKSDDQAIVFRYGGELLGGLCLNFNEAWGIGCDYQVSYLCWDSQAFSEGFNAYAVLRFLPPKTR